MGTTTKIHSGRMTQNLNNLCGPQPASLLLIFVFSRTVALNLDLFIIPLQITETKLFYYLIRNI